MQQQTDLEMNLLSQIQTILPRWLSGGTLSNDGKSYGCMIFKGDVDDYINVDTKTSEWSTVISNKSGRGLVSLYSYLEDIPEGDAYDKLIVQYNPTQINVVQQTAVMVPDNESVQVSRSKLDLWDSLGLMLSGSTQPIACFSNVKKCFDNLPKFQDFAYYDEFYDQIYTVLDSPTPKPLNDDTVLEILEYIQVEVGLARFTKEHVAQAIRRYAKQRVRNYPKDWLNSLVWDEKPRLYSFFYDAFGTPLDRYTSQAAVNFFIAMAARIFKPGCKHDHMVYLHGPQGIGKSSAWEVLGGPLYTSISYSMTSADFALGLRGYLIVELSELTGVKKADVDTIKALITRRRDDYRLRYEVLSKEHPRKCVFVGSANDDLQLQDNSGARRFWPIYCQNKEINLKYITDNRNQLFAEAVARFKDGEKWWQMPEDETKAVQARLRSEDIWEGIISRYLASQTSVTTEQIWTDCLGQDIGKANQSDKNRIAAIMKMYGYVNKVIWSDGKSGRAWVLND